MIKFEFEKKIEEKLTFLESISETDDSSDSDESESTESEHSTSISEPIVNGLFKFKKFCLLFFHFFYVLESRTV